MNEETVIYNKALKLVYWEVTVEIVTSILLLLIWILDNPSPLIPLLLIVQMVRLYIVSGKLSDLLDNNVDFILLTKVKEDE